MMHRNAPTLLLWMLVVGSLPRVVQAQAPVPTIDEVVAAARLRQEAVKTARFEWTVNRWVKKGANDLPGIRMPEQPEGPSPPEDLEVSNDRSLMFSADNLRYESFGPDLNVYTPFRLVTTWNGEKSNRFQDANQFLSGGIQSKPWHQYLDTFEPFAWTYRLLDPQWARFGIEEFTVRPELEQLDGEECVVLERLKARRAKPEEPSFQRLWLSRTSGYVVRRFERGTGATVYTRLDIDYGDSTEGITVPRRWTKVKGEASDPRIIEECTVVSYELNSAVDQDAFQLTFPADTWVEEEGVAEPYMVRDDGSRRSITTAELKRGATYEDIRTSPSGRARLTSLHDNSSVKWFWAIQCVLPVAIVAAWLWRRRTRVSD